MQVLFYAEDNHCPELGKVYKSFTIHVGDTIGYRIDTKDNCGEVTFNVIPKKGSALKTYSWTGDDSLSSSTASFTHRYTRKGAFKYYLTTTNSYGTTRTDSGIIYINNINGPASTPSIVAVGGDSLKSSTSGKSYTWFLNSTQLPVITRQIYAGSSGKYQVQVIDSSGCTSPLSSPYNFVFTGIHQASNLNDLRIYPNPTTGILTIETNGIKEGQLSIINLTGQVQMQLVISEKTEVDLHKLPRGVYLLKLQSKDGIMMERVILQ